MPSARAPQQRRRQPERRRREAQLVGFVGFAAAAALPWLLFGRVVSRIAENFHLEWSYLLQAWTPWVLIVAGLLFLVPVAFSAGRDPHSRWYPRGRNAYAGWGLTLYLLGFAVATQVAQLAGKFEP